MYFSDSEIIALIQRKKEIGIQRLFDRYYRPLVFYAEEYLKNQEEARDVVQDVFLHLWETDHLGKVSPSFLGTYLYTSVKNRCLKRFLRKDVLRNPVELKDFDIPVDYTSSIDEERIEQILREMEQLPPRTRQVMEYVIIKNLKYKDAAMELGISINTVKFLLKEGMKRLRNSLTAPGKGLFFILFHRWAR